MVGEWIETTLADACSSIDYGLTASAAAGEAGPKFLRITDIVSGQINWSTVPCVEADDETTGKYRLDDGDIVLARTGASTGASAYVKQPPVAVFASYLVRLKAKPDFDPRFLAYYLRSEGFWTFLRGVLGDKSAQPNASASTMTKAPLHAPRDKSEQQAIARILGTLDDKIELNRRMNETLESLAQCLFQEWFVAPTREGPPEGWRDGRLDEVLVFQRGFDLPSTQRTSGPYPVLTASGPSGTHGEFMVRGPGVTTGRSGLLGKVYYVHEDFWPHNTSLWVKEFRHATPIYALHLLRTLDFATFNGGSAVPTLNRNHVHNLAVNIPPMDVIQEFEAIVLPMYKRLQANLQESRTLAALRDALLPKLLSGHIRVRDAEKSVEEAL